MDFSKLLKAAGSLFAEETNEKEEVTKKVTNKTTGKVSKSTNAKTTSSKTSKTTKEKGGIDLTALLGMATQSAEIVEMLGNLGALKKTAEPESTKAQKMVSKIKSLVVSNIGTKVDDNTFKTIVTKLLSSSSVKSQIEKIAGSGTTTFIKNAITAFVSK